MNKAQNIMFELLRCTIGNVPLSDETKRGVDEDTLWKLYHLSKSHDIAHILAEGLRQNGLLQKGTEIAVAFHRAQQMAVYRYEQMQYEIEHIYGALEEAKISYIPLKGAVLRSYYPEPWMRTSCDIDILVKKEDFQNAEKILEEKLIYLNQGEYSHDVSMYAESGVHLELHYDLIEEAYYPAVKKILSKIWSFAELEEEKGYRYKMPTPIFYFYHIAHMAKHFEEGGCGIRPFIDIWLFQEKIKDQKGEIDLLLHDGKLWKFKEAAEKLSRVWFSQEEDDDLTEKMAKYVVFGGVYGTIANRTYLQHVKKGGEFIYMLSLVFLPYEKLKVSYPILKKHKWLYPFCQLHRWFNKLFFGISARRKQELKIGAAISKEQKAEMAFLLRELGL